MRISSVVFVLVAYGIVLASSKKIGNDDEDSILDEILSDPKLSSAFEDPKKLLEMLRTHFAGRLDEDEKRTICKCETANMKPGMIIRTRESQAAGAVFLSAPLVQSPQECIDRCCANESCTTAIIREKDDRDGCYLFNCLSPSVCQYSSNEKFTSYDMSCRSSKSRASTSKPLANTSSTVKGRNCGQYQFECLNNNEPDNTECVPIYNKCDGIAQCLDGSDEFQCDADNLPSEVTTSKSSSTVSLAAKTNHSISDAFAKIKLASSTPASSPDKVTSKPSFKTSSADDEKSNVHDREKWTISAVKGAIVALVLGVIAVIALLVFGCCQLQRMRWSSRKGRMRKGTDADYLINGLYL